MKRACHSLFVTLLVSLILPAAAMAQVIIGPGPGGNPEVQLIEPVARARCRFSTRRFSAA